MSDDKRDILETLKFELAFLEQGGHGRSVRTPKTPTRSFQDSLTCLNFSDPTVPYPCYECFLTDFVPENAQSEGVPCHHIPLNPDWETVDMLRDYQLELEEALEIGCAPPSADSSGSARRRQQSKSALRTGFTDRLCWGTASARNWR
jgi:hypothetical protein